MNIKDIAEALFEMEDSLDLFNRKIAGVHFWELVRLHMFSDLLRLTGLFGKAHTRLKDDSAYLPKFFVSGLKNIFEKNPFCAPKCDILLVGHPRRKLMEDGLWWDIYCDPLIDHIRSQHRCLLFEAPQYNRHLQPAKTQAIRHLDFLSFYGAAAKNTNLFRLSLTKTDYNLLSEIERKIASIFQVNINLKNIVIGQIRLTKAMLPLYISLIKKAAPNVVVVLVSHPSRRTAAWEHQ